MHTALTSRPYRRGLSVQALEFMLCLLVVVLLYTLAGPLGNPEVALGRNGVYQAASEKTPMARTAYWLMVHIGQAMAVFAMAGWAVLAASRTRLSMSARACAAGAIWGLAWGWLSAQPPGFGYFLVGEYNGWWCVSAACLVLWPLLTRVERWAFPRKVLPQPQQATSAWVYPGFVLLSGIGVLWLMDYSARSLPKFYALGLKQFMAWTLALMLLSVTALVRESVLRGVSTWLARASALQSDTGGSKAFNKTRWATVALTLLWFAVIALLGYLHAKGGGVQKANSWAAFTPSITSELLRLPVYVLGGWGAYRWLGQTKSYLLLHWSAGLALALTLALLLIKDNGPVLVLAYTVSVMSVAALLARWQWLQNHPRLQAGFSVLLAVGLVVGIQTAVNQLTPQLAEKWGVLQSLNLRLEAMEKLQALVNAQSLPAATGSTHSLDFLIVQHWFMQGAPLLGHGLGHVPWCGALGNLGGQCVGVSEQVQSDYTYSALVGVFGPVGALCVVSILLAWFWALLPRRRHAHSFESTVSPEAFGHWMLTLFVLTMMVQTAVTVLGSLALVPMTGVPMPLLSLGKTSLLVCAGFTGLAVNRFKKA